MTSANRHDELEALLTSREPRAHRNYLAAATTNRVYATGSTVPDLGIYRLPEVGRVAGSGPVNKQPLDFFGVYLTIDEYMPVDMRMVPHLIDHWISRTPQRPLLSALAILNKSFSDDELREAITEEFTAVLTPEIGDKVRNLLTYSDVNRWFVSRQTVLQAMRHVLARPPVEDPEDGLQPMVAAILLTHTVAASLEAHRESKSERTIGGHPTHLAMEIISNELFYAHDDPLAIIDRHVRLWEEFGSQVSRVQPRLPPVELIRESIGTDLLAVLSAGFGLWAHASAWEVGKPVAAAPSIAPGLRADRGALLSLLARTPEQFRQSLGDTSRSSWDLLPFEQTPVIDFGDGLLVVDEELLLQRVTSGLYWVVHDHERDRSESSRRLWTQVYGEMVELQAAASITRLAPAGLGGTSTVYTEEELQDVYSGKVIDHLVDFGHAFVGFEVVSGRMSLGSRVGFDVAAFEADSEKLVLKKVRQLDELGRSVLADRGAALTGGQSPIFPSFLPVVLVGGGFGGYPVNPTTIRYIRDKVNEEGLLLGAGFDPLCVIDMAELELLEGLADRGRSSYEALIAWQDSSLKAMPLRNWLYDTFRNPDTVLRPNRMKVRTDEVFDRVLQRLDLPKESPST